MSYEGDESQILSPLFEKFLANKTVDRFNCKGGKQSFIFIFWKINSDTKRNVRM